MTGFARHLTIQDFRAPYGGQKPHFEYWFGEAIQKASPTWLVRRTAGDHVRSASASGYKAGSEVELRIDPHWEPVPDVIGTLQSISDYPTEPVEIVVQILSPEDKLLHVLEKCNHYKRIGTQRVFVLDPAEKLAWHWRSGSLEAATQLDPPNGSIIDLHDICRQLDEQV